MVNYDRNDPVCWVGFMYMDSEGRLRRASVDLDMFNSMEKGATLLVENGLTYLEVLAGGAGSTAPRVYWDPLRSDLALHLTGLPENSTVLGDAVRGVRSVRASIDACRPPVYLTSEGDLFVLGSLWLTSGCVPRDSVFLGGPKERDCTGGERCGLLYALENAGVEGLTGRPDVKHVKLALADAKLRGLDGTFGYKMLEIVLGRIAPMVGGE